VRISPHAVPALVSEELRQGPGSPEYKVTAVQISPSNGPSRWQQDYEEFSRESRQIAPAEAAE
jgi:predicted molibdopterin-dependent oxidoreductase YjgC